MMKKMLEKILLVCLVALPFAVSAQYENRPPNNMEPVNRSLLLNKTWYFVAMKCPDKIGAESQYIQYFASLYLTESNGNNINYGTYVKTYTDARDNPKETGTYSLTTDDAGNLVLTLRKHRTNTTATYNVPMVEANHLTLIRTDDVEKCNVSYAVSP